MEIIKAKEKERPLLDELAQKQLSRRKFMSWAGVLGATVTVAGVATACKKDDNNPSNFLNGTYKGSFKRYHQAGSQEAQVTLEFNYPNWTGTSNIDKYPALNKGKYTYDDYVLNFTNTSAWTADFDWTFILNGAYIEHMEGDSLRITRSYPNGEIDVYRLKKQ